MNAKLILLEIDRLEKEVVKLQMKRDAKKNSIEERKVTQTSMFDSSPSIIQQDLFKVGMDFSERNITSILKEYDNAIEAAIIEMQGLKGQIKAIDNVIQTKIF
jgi:hypothetical protein